MDAVETLDFHFLGYCCCLFVSFSVVFLFDDKVSFFFKIVFPRYRWRRGVFKGSSEVWIDFNAFPTNLQALEIFYSCRRMSSFR